MTSNLGLAVLQLLLLASAYHAFLIPTSSPRSIKRQYHLYNAITAENGPILKPSDADDESSVGGVEFDIGCVANPVVLPPCDDDADGKWQMYYYGNFGEWEDGYNCWIPSGWVGLAESNDGIHNWTKIPGKCRGGSILAPEGGDAWDGVHIGVGDVIRVPKKQNDGVEATNKNDYELHMYYFGASNEEVSMGPRAAVGLKMKIGRAKSIDNGRTWEKMGIALDIDNGEGLFASWPRIVIPSTDEESGTKKPWNMFYHTFTGQVWKVYSAESFDLGETWTRTGLVLEGNNDDESSFDYSGIGTRAVTKWKDDKFLMIYEGVDKSSIHRLGAACCSSITTTNHDGDGRNGDDDMNKWVKLESGNPIIEPGKYPLGDWTSQVIGTPYIVYNDNDGSLRLYHCGKSGPDAKMSIGVLLSESGNVTPESWSSP